MAQRSFLSQHVAGVPGMIVRDAHLAKVKQFVNKSPQTAAIKTITITPQNSTVYTVTVNGIQFDITSDPSATRSEIANAFASLINKDSLVSASVSASIGGTNPNETLVLTALKGGVDFTLSVGANLSATNTVASAAASPIPFGAPLMQDTENYQYAQLTNNANLVAQVVVLTPTAENSVKYAVSVTIDGIQYVGEATSDSDATAAEICTAVAASLNKQVPNPSVIAAEDTGTLTLTSEIAGKPFSFGVQANGSTGVWAVTSDNSSNPATDLNKSLVGICLKTYYKSLDDLEQWDGNRSVEAIRSGSVWVETQDQAAAQGDVWIGVASTDVGKFRASSAPNYLKVSRELMVYEQASSASLAAVLCKFE